MDTAVLIDFLRLTNAPDFFVVAGRSFGFDTGGTALIPAGFALITTVCLLSLITYALFRRQHIRAPVLAWAGGAVFLFASIAIVLSEYLMFFARVDNIAALSAGVSGILILGGTVLLGRARRTELKHD